jgi:hypothetical protein
MFHEAADLITAIAAIGAAIASIRNSGKISNLHVEINSRMTQLLTETRIAGHAEGVEAGRQEQKNLPK